MSRPEDRLRMLEKVYEMSQANTLKFIQLHDLGKELDLSIDEIADILRYFIPKGFLRHLGPQKVGITPRGIDYIEQAKFTTKSPQMEKYSIFISRIDEHQDIANKLKKFLVGNFPEKVSVFVANDPLNIPFSEDWFERIKSGIKNCSLLIVLCTPDSVNRPWINFEIGAAAILEKKIGPICFDGLHPSDLPSPISYIRVQAIDCSNTINFKKHFDNLIERIASDLGLPMTTTDVLTSEFYNAIKPEKEGPFLSAGVDPSYKLGEDIVVRGNTSDDVESLTFNLYKVGNLFEKIKEIIVPSITNQSFEVRIQTDDLKRGQYGLMILFPSGEEAGRLTFEII